MLKITDSSGFLLAILDTMQASPDGLRFHGNPEDAIQVATFRYPEGHRMRDHRHIYHDVYSTRNKTQEVLLVWNGYIMARVYDNSDNLVWTGPMMNGTYLISYWGGVGYDVMSSDTVMMEVKSGPFPGDEKDRVLL